MAALATRIAQRHLDTTASAADHADIGRTKSGRLWPPHGQPGLTGPFPVWRGGR
jgi:hypothetical protein